MATQEDVAEMKDASPRKQYTTVVTERQIAAPREVAFGALCDLISEATGGHAVEGDPTPHGLGARLEFSMGDLDLVEEVISFEPPWRRVYELSGAPVVLYQGTTLFTDRGPTCLMAWSLLIDPLPDGGSDGFVSDAEAFLTRFADAVKARAEAETRSESEPEA
tara:strand:+ start:117 stop:605 length:489 start_codon:yes stop_codon:yes gene_type:complete